MIFAEKLIMLRKKAGWSQEELAAQLNVSRQSVSKWEGAQSVPDLEKMLRLSSLFGVSTDYLLKDDMEAEEYSASSSEDFTRRHVTMEDAVAFLALRERCSRIIASGVFLCILSPVSLLILGVLSEQPGTVISELTAGVTGIIVMLILVAAAVALFIYSYIHSSGYEYLEKEIFETDYGVTGMVREKKKQYQNTYIRNIIIGVCTCILSLLPFFAGVMLYENNDVAMVLFLCVSIIIVGCGVFLIVTASVVQGSYDRLLQEGDYAKEKKQHNPYVSTVTTVYWLAATAIFLAASLPEKNWEDGWIIWVIAGVLFPAVLAVVQTFWKKNRNDS